MDSISYSLLDELMTNDDKEFFQVLGQLKSGKVVIVFDQGTETCNILRSSDPALKDLGT